mmetsp:Transcript_6201/g.11031  ORF Transcript_6201/g.11031 Transcript_6201/m.11031 type:complete len:219 (-) Transcript_6201:83-739(-)
MARCRFRNNPGAGRASIGRGLGGPPPPPCLQPGLGGRKVAAADEGPRRLQRRQWRRVIGLQHEVALAGRVDQRGLGLGVGAPEHEDLGRRVLGGRADQGVGQRLPALVGMAGRLAVFHGQHRVEQQGAALGPAHQAPSGGEGFAEVALDLLEDVAQAGREGHALGHAERQALGLARAVVGVLAEDYDTGLGQRRQAQRTQRLGRVDRRAGGRALGQKG